MAYLVGEEKPSLEDLAHHGVKGMKWGVRRDSSSAGGGKMGGRSERQVVKAEKKAQKAQTAQERSAFYQKKVDNILKEAAKNPDTLIMLAHPGGRIVVTGNEFVNHMANGGLMNIKATDVYARNENGTYILNSEMNKPFVPSHKK